MSDYDRYIERLRRAVKAGAQIRHNKNVIIDDIRVRARGESSWDNGFYQLAAIYERQLRERFENESNRQNQKRTS